MLSKGVYIDGENIRRRRLTDWLELQGRAEREREGGGGE